MTENTILVVDADKENEEKIVSTLEAEGYLVFTASGKNVNAGMAKKLSFSLIYLKPTSSTIEGFETCRAIHKIEKFKDVPIILLATLQGRVDPRYTTYYGIIDYLKMPLNTEELIEKTRKILAGSSADIQNTEESVEVVDQEAVVEEEPVGFQEYALDADTQKVSGTEQTAEEDIGFNKEEDDAILDEVTEIQDEPLAGDKVTEIQDKPLAGDEADEINPADEDYSYRIEEEEQEEEKQDRQKERTRERETKVKPKSSGISILLLAGIAVVAIVAGFFSYRLYFSSPAVEKPAAVEAPSVQPDENISPPSQELQKIEETVVEPSPAETTKEVPVTVQEIEPKGKPVHSVQIGAFKSESSAEALANTYKGRGYEAFTQKGRTKNKEVIYRVLIGRFDNRKEALQFSKEVRIEEKIKTTVFSE